MLLSPVWVSDGPISWDPNQPRTVSITSDLTKVASSLLLFASPWLGARLVMLSSFARSSVDIKELAHTGWSRLMHLTYKKHLCFMLRIVFLLICYLPFALLYADFSHMKVKNVYLVKTIILFLWGFWPCYHATSCIFKSTVDRISILGRSLAYRPARNKACSNIFHKDLY